MRAIGLADSAQKSGKSAKICDFSGKFIHSFSRNLVLQVQINGFGEAQVVPAVSSVAVVEQLAHI
jgi:hypothetical protein